jgi:dipeptidyl aminopeptidase/acylaminoacyl peptidase
LSAADPTNRSERRPLTLDDLTALRTVADPQVSPDGRQVAFVIETMVPEANEVRSQIWLAPAEPGQAPRPLTTGKHQDQQPRWSPDGRTLAFVSNRTGSRQIWLLPLNGGEPRRLTNLPADVQSPVWSPDGQRLAFLTRGADRRGDPLPSEEKDPRKRVVRVRAHRHKLDGRGFFGPLRTHVWIVDLAGGAPTQVTDGPADDAEPAWSPDGRQLAFVSDRSPGCDWRFGGGAVHLVDLATGAARRLTPEGGRAAHPSWSPDGRMIAYVGSLDGDEASAIATRLWTVAVTPADGGPTPQCLTADLDRSVGQRPLGYLSPSPPAWSPDGESLLYLIGDGPSTHLVRNPRRGPRQPLSAGRRVVQSFTVDRAGQRAALLVTDAVTPAEVWLWDAATGAQSLTAVNRDPLAQLRLNPPEDLHLTRPDGTAIDGWLLRPAVAREEPVPLLLSVHGGPHNYFGDGFSFDHHLYAAQGYAVLYGNPRGPGHRSGAAGDHRRQLRRLSDLLGDYPDRPLRGRGGRRLHLEPDQLLWHLGHWRQLGAARVWRPAGRAARLVPGSLALDPRRPGAHAAAALPRRSRSALPDRAERAVFHRAAAPGPAGGAAARPRGAPRGAGRQSVPPGGRAGSDPGVAGAVSPVREGGD